MKSDFIGLRNHTYIELFSYILTGPSQVRLYSTSHRDIKPPSFDAYRWDHKKDATRTSDNEKQMTYHYLVTGGEFTVFVNFQLNCQMQRMSLNKHLNLLFPNNRYVGRWIVWCKKYRTQSLRVHGSCTRCS